MTIVKIDNIEYDVDMLSEDAKGQLGSMQFVDLEISRLQANLAAMQTARIAYGNALRAALPQPFAGDTIKLQ